MRNKKAKQLRKVATGTPPLLVEKDTGNLRDPRGYLLTRLPQLVEDTGSWKATYKKLKKNYNLMSKGNK